MGAAPRNVENTIWLPEALNRVTKASHSRLSCPVGSLNTGWKAPGVVGKLAALVSPTTTGALVASSARPYANETLPLVPPNSVAYTRLVPDPLTRATKAMRGLEPRAPGGVVGKSADHV